MNPALQLYQLQQIELELGRSRRRLQDIAAALADDAETRAAEARCQAARDALKPLRQRLQELEHETAGNEEKIRSTGETLYSGAVKSPREMQDMQMEVASLTRRNGDLETWSLEAMMAIEEAEARLAEAEAAQAETLGRRGEEHQELALEREALQSARPQLEAQLREAMERINPDLARRYAALRPRKGGQPVARMEGNTCALCGVSQTITVEREVRQGRRMHDCSNCGRILVALPD